MRDIIPHVSCIATQEEFPEVVKGTYAEIYIPIEDGFLKHIKLSGDRFARLKVKDLPKVPGVEVSLPKPVTEEINFLPGGKIPYSFFEQIVQFFRKVMELKKSDYEAHAWILWSKERGYFISVPKQTVSKASVSFSYDHDGLPPGSVIVVDLHSH